MPCSRTALALKRRAPTRTSSITATESFATSSEKPTPLVSTSWKNPHLRNQFLRRGGVARVIGSMRFGSHDEHQRQRRSGQAHRTIGRGAHGGEPQGGRGRGGTGVRLGNECARRRVTSNQIDEGRQTARVG